MALIFSTSSDPRSYQHSEEVIGVVEPFLHWLFPNMPKSDIQKIHHYFRKCGHVAEYAVLTLLLRRARRKPVKDDPRPWNWREARLTLLTVMLFAATDEFHQEFVPTRDSLVSDVFLDTASAAAALLALWLLGRWRKTPVKSDK